MLLELECSILESNTRIDIRHRQGTEQGAIFYTLKFALNWVRLPPLHGISLVLQRGLPLNLYVFFVHVDRVVDQTTPIWG